MGFINGLFILLSVISFFLIFIGLIKPRWFKMTSRLKAAGLFIITTFVCLMITRLTISDEEKARQKAEQEKAGAVKLTESKSKEGNTATPEKDSISQSKDPVVQPEQIVTSNQEHIEEKPSLTMQQRNAIRSAEQYLNISGFSKKGLIQQLSSDGGDGYDISDAKVAVENLDVDWNEQATRSATQYLNISGFSCRGLIEQLSSPGGDGYTNSQATYGAKKAGACS